MEKMKDQLGNVHYIGSKKLVDLETGEQFEAQTVIKTIGDTDFKKMFLGAVLEKIDNFGSSKMKFIFWLFDNADRQNRIIGTYKQLAEESGISVPTISRIIPILKDADVLRVISPSVYMLNPDLVSSISSNGRANLLVKYSNVN